MPQFVKVAAVNDVQPGTGTVVEVNGEEIALFNSEWDILCNREYVRAQGRSRGRGDT